MALLNGITGLQKGVKATVTLDKTALFALSPVVADEWFSVQANVQAAKIVYESTTGRQRKVLTFDLSESSPTCNLFFSVKARNSFQIVKIILVDFEKDILSMEGAAIPSELTISL